MKNSKFTFHCGKLLEISEGAGVSKAKFFKGKYIYVYMKLATGINPAGGGGGGFQIKPKRGGHTGML